MRLANFTTVPTIHAPRSRFEMPHTRKMSMNLGTLYPFELMEVYPGDSFHYNTTIVTRISSALQRPIMDDLYQDIFYFFIPSRLCYDKWEEIFGENRQSAWKQSSPVSAPTMEYVSGDPYDIKIGTVGDYLGLPITSAIGNAYLPDGINVLPFRAFALVYDQWFRDQNIIAPMYVNTGDWDPTGSEFPNDLDWSSSNYFGKLPKVAKMHDLFSSSLPSPQKGDPVMVPLSLGGAFLPLDRDEMNVLQNPGRVQLSFSSPTIAEGSYRIPIAAATSTGSYINTTGTDSTGGGDVFNITGTNLGVFLPKATDVTISDLRYCFQLQKILERSARSGSRYVEYLASAFNVVSPDARLQRTEYLGGKRIPISIQQVAQTSRTASEPLALGSLGAFSLTNGKAGFNKAFVEHGFILGVTCIRQRHSYQQGINKLWSRSDRFSYYDPCLATISEQPVYKDQIFGIHSSSGDKINNSAWGYQEAWAELRYAENTIAGQMRSAAGASSLDLWHLADNYATAPTLNKAWLEETPAYLDRALSVKSIAMDQFICDVFMDVAAVRRLPAYSVPSLVDHH